MNQRSVVLVMEALSLLTFSTGCFSASAGGEGARAEEATKCVSPEEAVRLADQTLQLVNLERAQRALQPVVVNPGLQRMAGDYACRLIEGKFFSHHDPLSGQGPRERAVAAKYRYYAVGENLAAGPSTAAEVMKGWMESPPHRDIILDPTWKEVGIAVRTGGEHGTYWVLEFGDPADF